MVLPEVMVTKKRPIHNVEQDEAGRKKPTRNAIDQNGLFPFFLHHIADFFLTLELHIVYQAFDALRIYHIWVAAHQRRRRGGRQDAGGHRDGLGSGPGRRLHAPVSVHEIWSVAGGAGRHGIVQHGIIVYMILLQMHTAHIVHISLRMHTTCVVAH